jgi:hypothetical protein
MYWTCTEHALNMHWTCTERVLNVHRTCTKHVLIMHWTCTEHALNMHWMFTELVLNMHWTCTEHALNMYWIFTENILNMNWTCTEHVLNMYHSQSIGCIAVASFIGCLIYCWFHIITCAGMLGEALRYIPEGCWFDSQWCHWNFSLTFSFQPQYGLGVDSTSNRNEYQGYFLGVKTAGA